MRILAVTAQRVAVDVIDPRIGTADIWIYDVSRGTPIRLTTDLADESIARSGRRMETRIMFRSNRLGAPVLFIKSFVDGVEEQVFAVTHR